MPASTTSIAEPQRILIVRLSAIGDVVHTMPIACALRSRFPKARIAWVVGDTAAGLLEGHGAIDQLIVLRSGWLKSFSQVRELRRRLRAERFDLVIEAQGLTKSAIVGWLSGAKRRIGFGHPWGRELSRWLNTETVDNGTPHAVDRNLELLQPVGIKSPRVRFDVPENSEANQAIDDLVGEMQVSAGFAIINSGAGWPSKLWPTERYSAVAVHLGKTWGLPTLVVAGGETERIAARKIVDQSFGHARLVPPITLPQLAALARRATLFIGSDTGPLHLAAAVATPCVGLYGPWPAERHGPYGNQHVALQERSFEGTTRQRRNASPDLMNAIYVDLVCSTCDRILDRDNREAA